MLKKLQKNVIPKFQIGRQQKIIFKASSGASFSFFIDLTRTHELKHQF